MWPGRSFQVGTAIDLFNSLGDVIRYYPPAVPAVFIAVLQAFAGAAVSGATAYFIVKRNPKFLRYYQIGEIAIVALAVLASILSAITVDITDISTGIGTAVGGALGLFLATMYFCKSVRVQTYMGSLEYQDRALFKVGV